MDGADLVMEVVGDDDRRHDLDTKRREYAQAGIPEYWIVDPREKVITVLTLSGNQYAEHGAFGCSDKAVSTILSGFVVDASQVFASADKARS